MLPLFRVEAARGLLLAALEQRFFPFTFRGSGSCVASHRGYLSILRSCYDAIGGGDLHSRHSQR